MYIWGSFIPPLVAGPVPIMPGNGSPNDKTPYDPTSPECPTPTLTLVLHQSVAKVPTEGRRPTYPEQLAIDEAEEHRIFVGPINMKLGFKVKTIKVRMTYDSSCIGTTLNQLTCLHLYDNTLPLLLHALV